MCTTIMQLFKFLKCPPLMVIVERNEQLETFTFLRETHLRMKTTSNIKPTPCMTMIHLKPPPTVWMWYTLLCFEYTYYLTHKCPPLMMMVEANAEFGTLTLRVNHPCPKPTPSVKPTICTTFIHLETSKIIWNFQLVLDIRTSPYTQMSSFNDDSGS